MATDTLVVQFASAGLVAAGLLATFSATSLFPTRTSIGTVTAKNPVPWSPRDLGGAGMAGSSPIFGFMWAIIYFLQFVFCIGVLINAFQQNEVAEPARLFANAACVCGSLFMASLWQPLFTEEKNWTFVIASVLLVVTAAMATTGAVFARPFFAQEWYSALGGVATTVFAGWTLVAAGLSVGIVTRVYNRGINEAETIDAVSSFFPLVLSVVVAVLAIVFANPIFPVTLLLTLPFVPGIVSDWKIWVPLSVCVVGVACAIGMVTLYTELGIVV